MTKKKKNIAKAQKPTSNENTELPKNISLWQKDLEDRLKKIETKKNYHIWAQIILTAAAVFVSGLSYYHNKERDEQIQKRQEKELDRFFLEQEIARKQGLEKIVAQTTATIEGTSSPQLILNSTIDRGQALAGLGQTKEAIRDFNFAIENDIVTSEQKTELLFKRGNLYQDLRIFGKALEDYSAIIDSNASSDKKALALLYRGTTHLCDNQNDKAIEDYTAIADMQDVPWELKAKAILFRGEIHRLQDKANDAVKDFSTVIDEEDTPTTVRVEAILNRANVALCRLGQANEAIEDCSTVIRMNDISIAQKNKAILLRFVGYSMQDQTDKARADLSTFLCISETDIEKFEDLLLVVPILKLSKPIAINPDVIDKKNAIDISKAKSFLNRGFAYCFLGKTKEAIAEYSAVIDMNETPEELKVLTFLDRGLAFGQLGKKGKTMRDLRSFIETAYILYSGNKQTNIENLARSNVSITANIFCSRFLP